MPIYEYKCQDCSDSIELLQSCDQMKEFREIGVRCAKCEGVLQWVFPIPRLSTDTAFAANWGDGFGDHESAKRKAAKLKAKRAGVSTAGKTYCPSLARFRNDPMAWVSHDDAKREIRKRCEARNLNCEEFGVKAREPESDPFDKPYKPAPDIVEREVERIVETEHEGCIEPKKRADLTEATAEKLAGAQD